MSAVGRLLFIPSRFELYRKGLIYRLIGVRIFKFLVPTAGDYFCRKTGYHPIFMKGWENGLETYRKSTIIFESIHWLFLIAGGLQVYFWKSENSVWPVVALNILVNFYPIITQRFNRLRIHTIQERRRKCESKK